MAHDVSKDHFAVIRIDGMHCHKCEQSIKKALLSHKGVHEVEVDFNSRQASVLFDQSAVNVAKLLQTVGEKGYQVAGYTMGTPAPRI